MTMTNAQVTCQKSVLAFRTPFVLTEHSDSLSLIKTILAIKDENANQGNMYDSSESSEAGFVMAVCQFSRSLASKNCVLVTGSSA